MKITILVQLEVTKPGEDMAAAIQEGTTMFADGGKILAFYHDGFLAEMED